MQSQTRGTPARYRLLLASAHSPIRTARISLANKRPQAFADRVLLSVDESSADGAARISLHEGDQQTREVVRQHADAPELQRHAQTRPLHVVELDRPARPAR